jgi:uncharacterized protein
VGINAGDIIFVSRTGGWGKTVVKELADTGIGAVILSASALPEIDPQMAPAFREFNLPLLSDKEAGVQVRGKQGLAGKESLDSALIRWRDEQALHEREKKSAMIEHIFKEYKSERGKEVRRSG